MNPRLGTLAAFLVCLLFWVAIATWLLGWPVNGVHAVLAVAVVWVLWLSGRDQQRVRRPDVYDWSAPGRFEQRDRSAM